MGPCRAARVERWLHRRAPGAPASAAAGGWLGRTAPPGTSVSLPADTAARLHHSASVVLLAPPPPVKPSDLQASASLAPYRPLPPCPPWLAVVIYYGQSPSFSCPLCRAVYAASGPKWRLAHRCAAQLSSPAGGRAGAGGWPCGGPVAAAAGDGPMHSRAAGHRARCLAHAPAPLSRLPAALCARAGSRCCPSGRRTGSGTGRSCCPTTTW